MSIKFNIKILLISTLTILLIPTLSNARSKVDKNAKKIERKIYKAYHNGDYNLVRSYIQKYLSVKKGTKNNNVILGETYRKVAEFYKKINDFQNAMTYLEKSIDAYQKVNTKEKTDIGISYNDIAAIYVEIGDLESAKTYLQKSIDVYKKLKGKKRFDIQRPYGGMASYYLTMGDYEQAVYFYKKQLSSCIEQGKLCKKIVPFYYTNIAKIYEKMENYTDALKCYQNALKIYQKDFGKNHVNTIGMYNRIGKLYLQTNNPEQAYEYFNLSMNLSEKKMHKKKVGELLLIVHEYNRIAQLFLNEGIHDKALIYFNKQIEVVNLVPQHRTHYLTTIYNNIAAVYARDKKYKESLNYLLKTVPLQIQKSGETAIDTITLLLNIAHIYLKLNNKPLSLEYYNKAINSCNKGIGKKHTKCGAIYRDLVHLYVDMKLYKEMHDSAKLYYDSFMHNKDQLFLLLDKKQKEIYLRNNFSKIELILNATYRYIQELKNDNDHKKIEKNLQFAMNTWLNYKESIFDSENAIAMVYGATKDENLKVKIDDLVSSKRYLAELYQSVPKVEERDSWKKNLQNTEEKIATLTKKIASEANSFYEQQGLMSINIKDITSYLHEEDLYIDFARVGNFYHLFTLDYNDKTTFTIIDSKHTQEIDSLVKSFRADLNTILDNTKISEQSLQILTVDSKEKLSRLYELVINNPLGHIVKDKSNLIISPDGALRLLPFEALYDKAQEKYFIENKEIRYIPSGKELARLYKYTKAKVAVYKQSAVIFANPNFNTKLTSVSNEEEEKDITPNTSRAGIIKSLFRMRFDPLPGTKAEAKEIKETLKQQEIQEYQENQATESILLKIKQPKILHIATHGFFINDNTIPNPMLKSGIALAGANTSVIKGKGDGIVTALKLSGLDLKGTDLVVLSACQTGVVDINSTDSISGLSKAFIQAGAKDIVMSLWSVDDQATKDLMTSFYQEMKEDNNYANALKAAKLKMIEEGRHPFYWAAFVVNGL